MPSPKTEWKSIVVLQPLPVSFAECADGIRIAAPYVKPCAITLVNAKPEDLSAAAEQQLRRLMGIAEHVDGVLDERQAAPSVRPWFVDYTSAVGGFHDVLVARSRTPASVSDHGTRAARLLARLFPEGAAFLRQDAYAAWAYGSRMLERVRELGLEEEIEEIAGAGTLEGVTKAADALRDAIGLGATPRAQPSTTNLQDSLAAFSRETARYARIIGAETDVTDAASVERYLRSVQRPLDRFRSRRNASGELVDPAEPASPALPGSPALPADPSTPDPSAPAGPGVTPGPFLDDPSEPTPGA